MTVAFVAGATGFTGSAVVAALRQQGIVTCAHVRPDTRDLPHWREHFGALGAEVDTTPWNAAAMTAVLRATAATHVFCCVGTTAKRMKADGKSENSYEAVDFALPKLLAEASVAAGAVRRFVYVSSLGASARAKGGYLTWRWRAEEAVRASGVCYTIARPSVITGARREARPAEAAIGQVLDGVLELAGVFGATSLRDRYRSTTDVRLAAALVRTAWAPEAANQVLSSEALYR